MTVLSLVELDGAGLADSSLRVLAFAHGLAQSSGRGLAAVVFGPAAGVPTGELGERGVADAYAIDSAEFTEYAPVAWARALAGLAADISATAVVAAGGDRGSELMAHLAAITGLPMAANCVSAARAADGECRLVRQRWAGSLLEDATLDADMALLTVATEAVAPAPEPPGSPAPEAPGSSPAPEAPVAPSVHIVNCARGELIDENAL